MARQTAEDKGLQVEVLDEDAIAELGLGGLLAVNQGSVEPPRLVKLTYSPRNPQAHGRARRQGHHVRLRRPLPEAERRACTR